MSNFIKGIWPRNLFAWLGLILGAMSVLALMRHGFDYGFGPTFTLLLAYYDNLIHALIGWWAEPIVLALLGDLSAYFGLDLHLHQHWKHVLVLMGFYVSRQATSIRSMERVLAWGGRLQGSSLFYQSWGLATALVTSVTVGSISPSTGRFEEYLLFTGAAIAGVAVFDLGGAVWNTQFYRKRVASMTEAQPNSWWREFEGHLFYIGRRSAVGVALALVLLLIPEVKTLQSPALAACALLTLALALEWLWLGLRRAAPHFKGSVPGRAHSKAVWALEQTPNVGAAMLGVAAWASVFVAANAGLRFYGL